MALKNKIAGHNVKTKQKVTEVNNDDLMTALQRLAMKNDIKGENVRTDQRVKEVNNDFLSGDFENLETSLNEHQNDALQLLQRLALKNKIDGVNVKTKQKVTEVNNDDLQLNEYEDARPPVEDDEFWRKFPAGSPKSKSDPNHPLLETMARLAMNNQIDGENVRTNQKVTEVNHLKDMLRLALKNEIKGQNVKTKQDVREINRQNDPISTGLSGLPEYFQRLALKNDIQGENVNTNQNVAEYNNKAFLNKLRKLALSNNIKGDNVETNQNVEEINEGEPSEEMRRYNIKIKIEDDNQNILDLQSKNEQDPNDNQAEKPKVNLRRMGIKNNIDGRNVNTTQEVVEKNLSNERTDSEPPQEEGQEQSENPIGKLQRLALKNEIAGTNVATKQNVQEINNPVRGNQNDQSAELQKRLSLKNDISGQNVNTDQNVLESNGAARKLALTNDIDGENVNTDQDIVELNDEIQHIIRRLALNNAISGTNVNTDQKVTEYNNAPNNDQMQQFAPREERPNLPPKLGMMMQSMNKREDPNSAHQKIKEAICKTINSSSQLSRNDLAVISDILYASQFAEAWNDLKDESELVLNLIDKLSANPESIGYYGSKILKIFQSV